MEIPDDYRQAAYRAAILNDLVKHIISRLLAIDASPLIARELPMPEAIVPESAIHEVLMKILVLKREAELVVESYKLVRVSSSGENCPAPQRSLGRTRPRPSASRARRDRD